MEQAALGGQDEPDIAPCVSKRAEAPIYAAIDLGTNSCRLLMATPTAGGFQVVDAYSRITRLGEGLTCSASLSEPAIERTLAALRHCARRLERRGAQRVRAVATAACRLARNCQDFVGRVHDQTGLSIEIISAQEEARLALAGCASLLDQRTPEALVFDIGGGSTELVQVKLSPGAGVEVQKVWSLPIGVVTLAERCGSKLHCRQGYAETVNKVASQLHPFDDCGSLRRRAAAGEVQILGTSGTVTTLAGVHLALPRYDRSAVDGLTLDFADIDRVTRLLVAASHEERVAHPCIGSQRADLVVAGCAILEAICRLWPAGRLRVADRGVREGVLLSMMRADQPALARQAVSR